MSVPKAFQYFLYSQQRVRIGGAAKVKRLPEIKNITFVIYFIQILE
jgi:hypothetical protein